MKSLALLSRSVYWMLAAIAAATLAQVALLELTI